MTDKIFVVPKFEADILKKMWISSSDKTTKALSEMINRKVDVTSTSLKILLINEVPKLLNPSNITTTLVYIQLIGAIKGVIIISSTLKNMLKMADILLHKELGYFKDLSDENIPVIKELGNILAGYYVTALNDLLGIKYEFSDPSLSINPYRMIEELGFGPVYKENIYVLMFKATLNIGQERIKKDIVLLFRRESLKELLETVSNKISFNV